MQLRVPTPAEHERAGLAYATRQQRLATSNRIWSILERACGIRKADELYHRVFRDECHPITTVRCGTAYEWVPSTSSLR